MFRYWIERFEPPVGAAEGGIGSSGLAAGGGSGETDEGKPRGSRVRRPGPRRSSLSDERRQAVQFPERPDLGDEARIETLIAEPDGDLGKVAKRLGVASSRLRKFVGMSPVLTAACEVVFEGAVDEAVASSCSRASGTGAAFGTGFTPPRSSCARAQREDGGSAMTRAPPRPLN